MYIIERKKKISKKVKVDNVAILLKIRQTNFIRMRLLDFFDFV